MNNKEDHLERCTNDLNEIINSKIQSELEQFLVDDQPPPFYSSPEQEATQIAKYRHEFLDETSDVLGNALNNSLTNTLNGTRNLQGSLGADCNKPGSDDHHELSSMPAPPASLLSDLYNGLQNGTLDRHNANGQTATTMTSNLTNYTAATDRPLNSGTANAGGNSQQQQQFYQQASDMSARANAQQQSIMMGKVSLFSNGAGTLELPPAFEHPGNFPGLKQTIYQVNNGQQQSALITAGNTTDAAFDQQQQLNEIYQYAASDQLSKSSTIDSDAAYSTLKLLDTASCNSSLIGGINNLNANDPLTKHCYPPAYTPSNFLTNNPNGLRIESETDSGYTFSSSNQNKPTLSNLISGVENDYIQGLKNQLNHSQSPVNHQMNQINQMNQMNHMIQINQLNQVNQLSQQLNQQLNSDCLYQPSTNFVRSRTTVDLNSVAVDGSLLNNSNLNTSASAYSFVNLPNSHCLTGDDHLLHAQFSPNSSYLTYQPTDITVLPATPMPCSSAKEALIQQQLGGSSNLVIMSNSLSELGQQSGLAAGSMPGNQESVWYKLLSRRLRERYISKRKVQDSSFGGKKSKLDQLDQALDDKKAMNAVSSRSSPFSVFYQIFLVKRCSLVPCLLIFACALLLFVIGLFTILTCYFRNQQNLLNDHHLLLTNSHTQLQQANLAAKAGHPFNGLLPQPTPPTSSALDALNRFIFGLTSIVKGVAVFGGSSSGSSSSASSLPNSLTTGESTTGKHAVQSETQLKLKQHQTNFWYKSAIFYEVFPASFQDSNNDGIGDLEGIISRLPYIKELGVTAIRLNSIFAALDYPYQFSNILNHTQIEKQLGEMSDFRRLVAACHQAGLRLVLDLNPTITSDQHRWAAHFLNYQNKTNDSHNYYVNTSDYVSSSGSIRSFFLFSSSSVKFFS